MHIFLLSLFICNSLFAVDYESQIQPIFNSSCGNCHLGNSSGGVNLSNYENTIESDILIAGDAESSSLYDRITRANSEAGDMPPGDRGPGGPPPGADMDGDGMAPPDPMGDMHTHMDDAAAHGPQDPGPGTPEPMAGDMDGDGMMPPPPTDDPVDDGMG